MQTEEDNDNWWQVRESKNYIGQAEEEGEE